MPCKQCKGANQKPGSRWYGRPCFRRQTQGRVERPLQVGFRPHSTTQSTVDHTISGLPWSYVAASRSPSLSTIQAVQISSQSHIQRHGCSTLRDSAKSPNSLSKRIDVPQLPISTEASVDILDVPTDILKNFCATQSKVNHKSILLLV